MIVLFVLVGLTLSLGFLFGLWQHTVSGSYRCCAQDLMQQEDMPVIVHGIVPKSVYDNFYELAVPTQRNGALSGIVAHHLIVGKHIAGIFESMGNNQTKQVVILSPNHFHVGRGPALTVRASWTTPYGDVQADARTIIELVKNAGMTSNRPTVQEDLTPFKGEHGINSLTPFIKRSFPQAEIIPLILDETLADEQAQNIATVLHQTLRKDAVVIASIDMSHNLPTAVQEFHDTLTQLSIESGELKHDLEIDSNASLKVLFELNKLRSNQEWHQTYHGSSLEMGVAQQWQDNTSHIIGYFAPGSSMSHEWTSFLFGGDVMLDRGTRKKILEADPGQPLGDPTYPWRHMERMTMGVDLRIANLEGTVNEQPSSYTYDPPFRFVFDPTYVKAMLPFVDVVSLANNHAADVGAGEGQEETHMWLEQLGLPWFGKWESSDPAYDFEIRGEKYRLIGYHEFRPDQQKLTRLIEEGKSQDRFVIVMPHWGVEYQYTPSTNQKVLAQNMIDAGADLIVGGHPHVVEGVELRTDAEQLHQVPVVYSLGNYVFDQQIPVTWDATMLGVIRMPDKLMLYFLPIGTKNSQPVPYGGDDASRVLRVIANASPAELRDAILRSVLHVSLP